ncbi:MAG: hypothetical protein OXH87_09485 [Rhodospirillaceae bacterium]|nr:hypothetical protein [Rhodospirillaceae bacterium]
MKTTIELPAPLFRQAKALAAARGVTLREFIAEAVEEQIRRCSHEDRAGGTEPPWMAGFGASSAGSMGCPAIEALLRRARPVSRPAG